MQLIESIQPSFSMHSKELLADIADNMVPAVKRVKQHHQLVENEIDRTYALGVATFEKGCKNDERALLDQHAAIEEAYRRCQVCRPCFIFICVDACYAGKFEGTSQAAEGEL